MASVADAESSLAAREVSRMRWNSCVSCAPTDRTASSSPLSVGHALRRLRHVGRGRLQLPAKILERRLSLAKRFYGRLRLERLQGELVDGQPMFLKVAVGRRDLFGNALGLVHLFEQAADACLDLLEALRALVVAGDLLAKVVELLQRELGLLADLVERFARLSQLRGAPSHLREHCAQRRALVARLAHEGLQLVLLLLLLVAADVAE